MKHTKTISQERRTTPPFLGGAVKSMEEITLLEAMYRLRNHKKKSTRLLFLVTFHGTSRKARFGKKWSKVMKAWQYLVQDEDHGPCFVYDEKAIVSAIASIPGIRVCGNIARCQVFQEEPEVTV